MSSDQIHEEKELLLLVSKGDEKAFTAIMKRYTPVIYKHLLIYIKNAPRAEELTQDIFISVWRQRERLWTMDNFAGYIYVATRNAIHMAFREKLHATEEPAEDVLHSLLAGPQAAVELKELSLAIDRAIEMLPPRRKQVFKLSRMANMSYEEIANSLQISRSAVKQHVVEALAFLRHYLKEEMGVIVSFLWWLSVRN